MYEFICLRVKNIMCIQIRCLKRNIGIFMWLTHFDCFFLKNAATTKNMDEYIT